MRFSVRLLGEFHISLDGKPFLELSSRYDRDLFLILASQRGKSFSKTQLAALVWGEGIDRKKGLNSLKNRLSTFRPKFGDAGQLIESVPGKCTFLRSDDFFEIDTEQFAKHIQLGKRFEANGQNKEAADAYKAALAWYRGDFLQDFEFEWATPLRQQYQSDCLTALDFLENTLARRGKYHQAIQHCQAILQASPSREDTLRHLMVYLHMVGMSADALAWCDQIHTQLETLSAETEQLRDAIKTRQLTLDEPLPPYQETFIDALPPPLTLPLIDRESVFQQLTAHSRQAASSHGRLILVEGESGMGKTRLLRQFEQTLAAKNGQQDFANATVVHLNFSPFQPLSPYQDWIDALAPSFDHTTLENESSQPAALEGALIQQIITTSQQNGPMFLLLDNLHYADENTLHLLDRLCKQSLHQHPILILGAYRADNGHTPPALQTFVDQVRHGSDEGHLHHLRLKPIEREAFRKFFGHQVINLRLEEDVVGQIHQRSGGNPYLLTHLIRMLVEQDAIQIEDNGYWSLNYLTFPDAILRMPKAIESYIQSRLASLDEVSQELMKVMSVISWRFQEPLLFEFWKSYSLGHFQGASEQWVSLSFHRSLDALIATGLMVQQQPDEATHRDIWFAHELTQDTVYANIPANERRALHEQLVHILERLPEKVVASEALLCEHHFHAEHHQEAIKHFISGLEELIEQYQFEKALVLADKIIPLKESRFNQIEIDPNSKFNARLLQFKACEKLGRTHQQEHILNELEPLVLQLKPFQQAQVFTLKGSFLDKTSNYDEAINANKHALQLLDKQEYPIETIDVLNQLGINHIHKSQNKIAIKQLEEAFSLSKKYNAKEKIPDSLRNIGWAYWLDGDYKNSELKLLDALDFENDLGISDTIETVDLIGSLYWTQNRYDAALKQFNNTFQLASSLGRKKTMAKAISNLGLVNWSIGNFEDAIKYLENANVVYKEMLDRRGEGLQRNNLAFFLVSLGDSQKALQIFEEALDIFSIIKWEGGKALVYSGLAALYLQLGELERAKQYELDAVDINTNIKRQFQVCFGQHRLGRIEFELGNDFQALEHFQDALAISEELGMDEEKMAIHSSRALAHARLGNLDQALSDVAEADALLKNRTTNHRIQVLFNKHTVLQQAQRHKASMDALLDAHSALMQQAMKLRSRRYRQSFLSISMHAQLLRAHFAAFPNMQVDEAACFDQLRKVRWADGVFCPYCQSKEVRDFERMIGGRPNHRYVCGQCKIHFNDLTLTIFQAKKRPLDQLFQALMRIHLGKSQTARDLVDAFGISMETAKKWHESFQHALQTDPWYTTLAESLIEQEYLRQAGL